MAVYLLLMRHGSVDRDRSGAESGKGLSRKGMQETYEVARALREHLSLLPAAEPIHIREIRFSTYKHARETADILYDVLKTCDQPPGYKEYPELSPSAFWPIRNEQRAAAPAAISFPEAGSDGDAILIIGHEPYLGWIAKNLLFGWWRKRGLGEGLPPAIRSEVHCLRFESARKKPARHIWSISPSDPETVEALREKIKSKMTTAAQLSAFITLLLTFSLGILVDRVKLEELIPPKDSIGSKIGGLLPWIPIQPVEGAWLHWTLALSIAGLFIAMALYLRAMYAYDSLLMPSRFWIQASGRPPKWMPARPPSSAVWVLYTNMTRIWRGIFTLATFAVVIALLGIAEVVFRIHPADFLAGVLPIGLLFWGYVHFYRPRVGSQD
jgi:phosphohistidine phosphatase SixA